MLRERTLATYRGKKRVSSRNEEKEKRRRRRGEE